MNRYRLTEKLRRYKQIINVVTKYGFGIIVEKTHLGKLFKIPSRKRKKEEFSAPVRVRKMLEELGPVFIKLGQILSTRPDFVPLPYIHELEKLQDSTFIVPFEKISEIFRKETGKSVGEVFSEFEEVAFASASVSQVHRAKYKGTNVAVKIQKPGIEEQIKVDISIMYDIAELIEKFIKESQIYQPLNIVREFEKSLKKELDFSMEGRNIERFRENFEKDEDIYVPFVFRELTTRRVLTLEFVKGIKINRINELEKAGIDKKKLSEIGLNSMMKQIFIDGFFHGDPHPANILVTEECRLCFIDFGIVGRISEERRLELIYFLKGLTEGNSSRIMESLEMMGAMKEDTDTKSFREEIEEILDQYREIPIKDIDINTLIEDSFSVMRKYYIRIPANFTLLIKTMVTLEGIGLSLNPDFSIAVGIKPHIVKFMAERARLKNILKDIINISGGFARMAREVPASIDSLMKMLKKGYINIAFEHKGLHDLISTIDKSSSRLSFSLIIAALIISSSLIMMSDSGRYPVFGVVGFSVSAILGVWLVIDILRHRSL
ncbi:MAG TPA: AarF/UbiB family protein [bacterium]|nr:AarF/UbiB family protein [bacterium]